VHNHTEHSPGTLSRPCPAPTRLLRPWPNPIDGGGGAKKSPRNDDCAAGLPCNNANINDYEQRSVFSTIPPVPARPWVPRYSDHRATASAGRGCWHHCAAPRRGPWRRLEPVRRSPFHPRRSQRSQTVRTSSPTRSCSPKIIYIYRSL
jgi:hypothetical protein